MLNSEEVKEDHKSLKSNNRNEIDLIKVGENEKENRNVLEERFKTLSHQIELIRFSLEQSEKGGC